MLKIAVTLKSLNYIFPFHPSFPLMKVEDAVLEAEEILRELRSGQIAVHHALPRLKRLSLSYPGNARIARIRAKALVAALTILASKGRLGEAENVFEELLEATTPYSNVGVTLERLNGAVTAIALLAKGEKTATIPGYLSILREAYKSNPEMFDFAFSLGAGLSNAIYQYAKAGAWQEVKRLTLELLELGRMWEGSRVQLTVSHGLFNVIVAANPARRLDVSEPLLSALIEQASRYPKARETQLLLAQALADSIYGFGVEGQVGKVSEFLKLLKGIFHAWSEDPEFAKSMLAAFKHALLVYHKLKMMKEFKRVLGEFESFASMTDNPTVRKDLELFKRLLKT